MVRAIVLQVVRRRYRDSDDCLRQRLVGGVDDLHPHLPVRPQRRARLLWPAPRRIETPAESRFCPLSAGKIQTKRKPPASIARCAVDVRGLTRSLATIASLHSALGVIAGTPQSTKARAKLCPLERASTSRRLPKWIWRWTAKEAGLIRGGADHAPTAEPAHDDGPTAKLGPITLLDGGVKRVHIDVQDRQRCARHGFLRSRRAPGLRAVSRHPQWKILPSVGSPLPPADETSRIHCGAYGIGSGPKNIVLLARQTGTPPLVPHASPLVRLVCRRALSQSPVAARLCGLAWQHSHPFPPRGTPPGRLSSRARSWQ